MSSREFFECARNGLRELVPFAIEGASRRDKAVVTKRDGSLVTALDQEIEARLLATFRQAFPNVPILGEEGAIDRQAQSAPEMYREFINSAYQIIIDPIDGTRNFIEGSPRYCIAVALSAGQNQGVWPIAGVIAVPAEQAIYWSDEDSVFVEYLVSGEQQHVRRIVNLEAPVSVNSRDRAWLAAHHRQLLLPWVSSGSSVYDFLGTVIGRNRASIAGSQRLWDLMAPLALALRSGLILRDLETGGDVTSITMDQLSTDIAHRPWGLARKMLIAPRGMAFAELFPPASDTTGNS